MMNFKNYNIRRNNKLFESVAEEMYDEYNAVYVLNEFVDNPNGHQNWAPLINPAMYQKALQEFTKYGKLTTFPEKYVYQWIGIITRNTLILEANSELAGHSLFFPYEDLENSRIFGFMCKKFGFIDINIKKYECEIECKPKYIVDKILEKSHLLDKDELEIVIEYKEHLNENIVAHRFGQNKGQMTMFLSLDELNNYDKKQIIKKENIKTLQIIEIYNSLYIDLENSANFILSDSVAKLNDNGNVIVTRDVYDLLCEIGLYDWMLMPDGSDAWSDYGIKPLLDILEDYNDDTTPEEALVMVNKALDVYHLRGDLASCFIEGGRKALNNISNGGEIFESIYTAYHGSPSRDIVSGKFRKGNHGILGPGMYFSEEKDYTKKYAKKYGSGAIYTVEIDIENPLILKTDNPTEEFLTFVYKTTSIYKRRSNNLTNINYIIETKDIKKFLSLGYDGIIWDYAGNKEFVVYDKAQIKLIDRENI